MVYWRSKIAYCKYCKSNSKAYKNHSLRKVGILAMISVGRVSKPPSNAKFNPKSFERAKHRKGSKTEIDKAKG